MNVSPLTVAVIATQNERLRKQQETINMRLDKSETIMPSRMRVMVVRKRGLRGPLTRAELAKAVR